MKCHLRRPVYDAVQVNAPRIIPACRNTLNVDLPVSAGQWIVTDPHGNMGMVKPEHFKQSYEPIEDTD